MPELSRASAKVWVARLFCCRIRRRLWHYPVTLVDAQLGYRPLMIWQHADTALRIRVKPIHLVR
jgi:hypothetical protein